MRPYSKYRDSGISWLPSIPQDWLGIKFKFVTSLLTCGHAATPEYTESNDGVAFLSAQNIKNERIDLTKYNYIKKELHQKLTKYKKVEKGDLLQVRVGGASTIGQTAIVDVDFDFSIYVSLTHLKLNQSAFNGYIKHLLNSDPFKRLCTAVMKTGAGVANLNVSDLEILKIPLPPISEQTQIAQYLDHKTSQIDKLIADKEKLIELLNEERTAIINQAVTKGLNPEVPMKDSGIEGLGEVPKHWNRIRIKNLVSIKVCDGPHETPQWVDEGIVFISAEAIKDGKIDFNFKRGCITLEQHEEYCKKSKVCLGDILFCKSGSTTGKSAMVETNADFGIWSPLAIIRANPKKINNFYLFQVIQSVFFRKQVETAWTFGTQPNIGMGALENLWITLPSSNEQDEIVKYLNEQHQLFDKLKSKIQGEIQLLKEYKTALISEVVTGKVDVRDEIIAESTELVS